MFVQLFGQNLRESLQSVKISSITFASSLYISSVRFFTLFVVTLSIPSNHNHKFNFYSPRCYPSWLFTLHRNIQRSIQRPIYASVSRYLTDTSLEEARVPQAGTIGRARETRVPASRCTWIALILRAAAPCTSTNLRVRFVIDESDRAGGREREREGLV